MNQTNREELYRLYVLENMTMKQISESLGISVGKIYKLIHLYNFQINDRPRKPYSAEIRRRMSERRKGVKLNEETKRKISESHKKHSIGHSKRRDDGYIAIYFPDHPKSNKDGYIMEHHLVMEKHIGRFIADGEVVHHINKIRDDNRIENLQLMTFGEHARFHLLERRKRGKNI